jgi:formate hydrogenlyase subunit 4
MHVIISGSIVEGRLSFSMHTPYTYSKTMHISNILHYQSRSINITSLKRYFMVQHQRGV